MKARIIAIEPNAKDIGGRSCLSHSPLEFDFRIHASRPQATVLVRFVIPRPPRLLDLTCTKIKSWYVQTTVAIEYVCGIVVFLDGALVLENEIKILIFILRRPIYFLFYSHRCSDRCSTICGILLGRCPSCLRIMAY